jgi:hypothetical protein
MRKELTEELKNGVLDIQYTKKDGAKAFVKATLMEEHLPPLTDDDYLNVWDVNKQGWIKIRPSHVIGKSSSHGA